MGFYSELQIWYHYIWADFLNQIKIETTFVLIKMLNGLAV